MLLNEALTEAIFDEYRARATYQQVINVYGNYSPFSQIVLAEQRHIDMLASLFSRYGMLVPTDPYMGNVQVQSSFTDCCLAGITAELNNIAMYDRLMSQVQQADVLATFNALRSASLINHLPAFQRCATQTVEPTCVPTSVSAAQPKESRLNSFITGVAIGATAIWVAKAF